MARDTIVAFIVIVLGNTAIAQAKDITFTEADRDRIIRTEARLDEGLKRMEDGLKAVNLRMDEGFKAVNQRLSDMRSEIAGLRELVYVVIAGIFVLIGFVLWDRRSTISPVITRVGAIEVEEQRMKRVLRMLATRDKKVEEILRQEGLL